MDFKAFLARFVYPVLSVIKSSGLRVWHVVKPQPDLDYGEDRLERKEIIAVSLNMLAQALYFCLWYAGTHLDRTLGQGFKDWAFTVISIPVGFSLDIALVTVVAGLRKGRKHWFWSTAVIGVAMAFNAAVALDFAGVTYNGKAFGGYLHVANALTTMCLLMHVSQPKKPRERVYRLAEYQELQSELSVKDTLIEQLQGYLRDAGSEYNKLNKAHTTLSATHQQVLSGATALHQQNQKLLMAPPQFDEDEMWRQLASGKYKLPVIAQRLVTLCDDNYTTVAERLGTSKQTVSNWINKGV
ncbi:MAG: hypothetical protein IT564_11385 [Rhodospirillales bacterium]|nr:hypothetical protein [Rhodospirillales bacterium]